MALTKVKPLVDTIDTILINVMVVIKLTMLGVQGVGMLKTLRRSRDNLNKEIEFKIVSKR